MDVASFSEIADEFDARVARIVWCTFTTVDGRGRPRSRMLHPIWDGPVGWIATGRQSFKARHIEQNPFVSVTYWDPEHTQIYAECKAEWEDDPAEKARIWEYYASAPPPLGYDLSMFWPGGATDASYGLLKLTPWRLELSALQDLVTQKPALVWRQDVD